MNASFVDPLTRTLHIEIDVILLTFQHTFNFYEPQTYPKKPKRRESISYVNVIAE